MHVSYRVTRNVGLVILLAVIFFEGLYSYHTISRNSERLREIITKDEVILQRWDDVTEIIEEAKDRLYDYRLGRMEVIATTDLLINRVMKEVREIRKLVDDESSLTGVDEILNSAALFKEAVLDYGVEVRTRGRDADSARRLGDYAVSTADRMALLVRGGAVYVNDRIKQKHLAILERSSFSQKMLGLALVLASLLTVGVSAILARNLAAPIRKLVEGTKNLAAGDLSCRVEINSRDEIGQLAASFNAMAEELTRFRNELLAAKRFTDNIIDSMINTLVVLSREGTIKMVNRATRDLLGYREEELVGEHVSYIFANGYFEELGLEELADRGFAGNMETAYKTRDGKKVRVLLSGSIVLDDGGEFAGFVFVAQDITMQAEALRAGHLASLGELAAGVAHEINNPINSIINFAQLLIDEMQHRDPASGEILPRIIKEGDRISGIVRSLLSFAREGDRNKDLVHVRDILSETLALTEIQIRKDGIHLHHDLSPSLPLITGHFQQIQQVFLNIINNARYALNRKFEFAHPEKILRIDGKEIMESDEKWVEIAFLDQGVGIPASIIDKVKNPFFSTKPAGLGTGLGLTISHGIVTDHGGKLDIESREGEFTRIRVRFPAHFAALSETSDGRELPLMAQ